MGINDLFSKLKGGAGSGNRGHAGIPGHRGGSATRGLSTIMLSLISSSGDYEKEQVEAYQKTMEQIGDKATKIKTSTWDELVEGWRNSSGVLKLAYAKEQNLRLIARDLKVQGLDKSMLSSSKPQKEETIPDANLQKGYSFAKESDFSHQPNLDQSQIDALKWYTSEYGYESINNLLRFGGDDPKVKKAIDKIDSAIKDSSIPKNIILTRGIDSETASEMTKGSTFIDEGFSSTSINNKLAFGDYDYEVKIHASKGKKGLYVNAYSDMNDNDEKELMLPRNSKLKIQKIDKKNKTIYAELL